MPRTTISLEPLTLAMIDAHARAAGMSRRAYIHHAIVAQMHHEDEEARIEATMKELFPGYIEAARRHGEDSARVADEG